MESLTPAASQEHLPTSSALSIDGENTAPSPVLPLPRSQSQGSKPRKAPTITPRTFTRFFTPKSSLERGGRIGASRKALRDITASASNRRGRRTPTKDTIQIFDEDLRGTTGTLSKKRRIPDSVDGTPDRSSPLKRIRNQSLEIWDGDGSDAEILESGDEVENVLKRDHLQHRRLSKTVDPVIGSRYRRGIGRDLRREMGAFGKITKARSLNQGFGGSKDWQHGTTNFFTRPEDAHLCTNVAAPADLSIPFCTATCNSELFL